MHSDIKTDPNINYNILEGISVKALNKHIPLNKLKFDKYKHKKSNWITTGIIKTIKFRDGLYKRLKQFQQNSIEYFNNKQKLIVYNNILKALYKKC